MVGRLTSWALPPPSTDSGFGSGIASGGAPGQIGVCTRPAEGCQAAARAGEGAHVSASSVAMAEP
jgi:hypothetical protein